MKDKKIFSNSNFEAYFGLFAPCIVYYRNGYVNNNRLVISLIFLKLYFNIGKSNSNDSDAKMYGFYFDSDPDSFIAAWNTYYKSWLMPWTKVLVNRQLLTSNDIILLKDDKCLSLDKIKELMKDKEISELCTRYYKYNDIVYTYYVTHIIKRPVIFKRFKLFDSESFEIYTTLQRPLKQHNFTQFKMSTDYNIAIPHQINVQIASMDC